MVPLETAARDVVGTEQPLSRRLPEKGLKMPDFTGAQCRLLAKLAERKHEGLRARKDHEAQEWEFEDGTRVPAEDARDLAVFINWDEGQATINPTPENPYPIDVWITQQGENALESDCPDDPQPPA